MGTGLGSKKHIHKAVGDFGAVGDTQNAFIPKFPKTKSNNDLRLFKKKDKKKNDDVEFFAKKAKPDFL